MRLFRLTLLLIFIVSLTLTACGADTPTEAAVAPTTEAEASATATSQPATATPQPTFTATSEPTATPTTPPTDTPTPSPTPEAKAKVNEDLTIPINVRQGPGTAYPVIRRLELTEEAKVTGRNEDESWWQINLAEEEVGWVYSELVTLSHTENIPLAETPPTPIPPTPEPVAESEDTEEKASEEEVSPAAEELAETMRCGKDFCITYQAMVPMAENGGCIGNHSIYITVLQGPPPGVPMDGVVIGDTFDNVEVGSGSHGPGRTEITLWSNSMKLYAKRNMDGTPYSSEESFNFTSHDELIPAELLAANGYCGGNVQQCEHDRNHNSVCRGHYSWRVTFHKF